MAKTENPEHESVLLFCKNSKDRALLKHLVNQYSNPENQFVQVLCGFGGTAADTISEAIKQSSGIAYDRALLVIDGASYDETLSSHSLGLIDQKQWKMVVAQPCMEAMLLKILEPQKSWHNNTDQECLSHFEAQYLAAGKRTATGAYGRHFNKENITEASKTMPELREILYHISPSFA